MSPVPRPGFFFSESLAINRFETSLHDMRVQIYQLLHILGNLMIFLGYGGLCVRALTRTDNRGIRRLGAITSGIGLLLSLVGGFGLLARMGYGWPTWVIVKMGVWVALGVLIIYINRRPQYGQIWWWTTLVLGLVAVIMVYFRPFQ